MPFPKGDIPQSCIDANPATWRGVPRAIRNALADALGTPIVNAMRTRGAFGPTPAFRLRLADGRRVFVKGCSPAFTDEMREAFRHELLVYEELGGQIGAWTPAVRGHVTRDGWELLALDDLGPETVPPWSPGVARSVVRSFAEFHAACRHIVIPDWVRRPAQWLKGEAYLWAWTGDPDAIAQRATVAGRLAAEAADWLASVGPSLAAISCRLLTTDTPPQLLHLDVRSDNIRWKDGRLYLFDWADLVAGAPELDLALFTQTITVESGLAPERIVAWYEEVCALDGPLLDAAVCAVAGLFGNEAWRPDGPVMPRLRAFQREQLVVSLEWALRRLGLEPPRWLTAVDDGVAMRARWDRPRASRLSRAAG